MLSEQSCMLTSIVGSSPSFGSASEMHHPLVAVGANENSAKSTAFALLASLQFELVSGKSDEGDPWCSGVGNVCLCS